MDGYTLKLTNQKTWSIVYAVIRDGMFTMSEDKDNHQEGEHLRVTMLNSPAVFVGKATDKRYSNIYFIKINFSNYLHNNCSGTSNKTNMTAQSPTTTSPSPLDKTCTVTLGFRIEETRNTWFYAIMTEHAKLFLGRTQHEQQQHHSPTFFHYPRQSPASALSLSQKQLTNYALSQPPSTTMSTSFNFKLRGTSLRKKRSIPSDEQQRRRRSLSLNFENIRNSSRPLSRVFSSIFATNNNSNNNNNIKTTPSKSGRSSERNSIFGFLTPEKINSNIK